MFARFKKMLDRSLELLLTIAMTVLVLDVIWQVFTRYVLDDQSSWTEELATFLMVWVGLLGASVALNRGAHLGIDYFVQKLSDRKRLYVEVFIFLCIGLFSLLVLFIGGIQLVSKTLAMGQMSAALKMKMGYVYLALPISGFFLVFYSADFLIERIIAIVKHRHVEELKDFESTAAID